MTTWVLIYWIITVTNSVTGSVAFDTADLCQSALSQIQDDWSGKDSNGVKYGAVGGICTAQGTASTGAPSQPQPPSGKK